MLFASSEDNDVLTGSLGELMRRNSLAGVDNSGSTSGVPLGLAKAFVDEVQPTSVQLWNSCVSSRVPPAAVSWRSTGGTSPSNFARQLDPGNLAAFVFMTDGQVYGSEITGLANEAHKTATVPSVFVIFAASSPSFVAQVNISVFMSHFTTADQAILLCLHCLRVPNKDAMFDLKLLAVRGDEWRRTLPECPALEPNAQIDAFPSVSFSRHLAPLPCVVRVPRAAGAFTVEDGRILDTTVLLSVSDVSDALSTLTANDFDQIARMYHTAGRLNEWFAKLQVALTSLERRTETVERAAVRQSNVNVLLRRLRAALEHDSTGTEATALRDQIRREVADDAARQQDATLSARSDTRDARALLNRAMASCTAIRNVGASLSALGVLSNRAARATTFQDERAKLATLDMHKAPEAACDIMLEVCPVGTMLACMDDERASANTGDFVIDSPFQAGRKTENILFDNVLIGLTDGTADRIEMSGRSPTTRTPTAVCLPFVSLASQENRNIVLERLCAVFTKGRRMAHVWAIAIGVAWETCQTKAWAAADSAMGRLLRYFIAEVMHHVPVAADHRLNLDRSPAPYQRVIVRILNDSTLTQHTHFSEASLMLSLLWDHRDGTTVADDDIVRAMIARAATAVPQCHLAWLKAQVKAKCKDLWKDCGATSLAALTSSVYETRVAEGSGKCVPIAGRGFLVNDLTLIFPTSFVSSLEAFCLTTKQSLATFCTPALTIAIFATLEKVIVSSMTDASAVDAAREIAGPQLRPDTCRVATEDDAIDMLRRKFTWARTAYTEVPPFATHMGQSSVFFYRGDGPQQRSVINMLEGCHLDSELSGDRFEAMAAHVRTVRGQLMQREYATKESGSFDTHTTTTAFARGMVDAFVAHYANHADSGPAIDLNNASEVGKFVHKTVSMLMARTGNAGNLHHEQCEQVVLALLPSFMECVARDGVPCISGKGPSLIDRLRLEIGERDVASIRVEDAPLPVPVVVGSDEEEKLAALRVAFNMQARALT